ncbi:hypothetical protein [Streptomyces sp. NPDC020983]|uniref:hypothetical protein n=1 Tax=Streptomyces sp. NPDC020983 TaxID=3365106 RepID=UPI0037B0CCA7
MNPRRYEDLRSFAGRLRLGRGGHGRAVLARLRNAEAQWQLEREILRRASQYVAREMRA